MAYWGKMIGGMAGFMMGGPVGAFIGAGLGHAADEGVVTDFAKRALPYEVTQLSALLGPPEQVFTVSVTVLAAKLAKCDGPVSHLEIDAFKRSFPIPEGQAAEVARMFNAAREHATGFEIYAMQMGRVFGPNHQILAQVLAGLNEVARADGPINAAEADFLARVAHGFGMDMDSAQRAGRGVFGARGEDPYKVLGIDRRASNEAVRARWKELMRENHPDSLASRGATAAAIAAASDQVARINAAYDVIKRDRKL
jgi:DnaJ like chaperone protein